MTPRRLLRQHCGRAVREKTQDQFVDARDIAQVAYRVLAEEGHQNTAYYLSGPEALSGAEIANILSSTGKVIKYVDVPAEAARTSMLGAGMPAEIVEGLLEHFGL
jgi:uncharacterized protein YbjT (DUF2867 family)